jgi:hypothetical protein
MKKTSLTMKLNLVCVGLVIVPLMLLGFLTVRSLNSFSSDILNDWWLMLKTVSWQVR